MTERRPHLLGALALLVAIFAIAMATAAPAGARPVGAEDGAPCPGKPDCSTVQVEAEANSAKGPLAPLGGESKSHPHPIDYYELDEDIELEGIEDFFSNIGPYITQWFMQILWSGLIYVFNGIMVMLSWAFSLDLLGGSMGKLASALQTLREHIITPWGIAAFAAMALWGIWNGLVRKKSIDTIRGLSVSLLFMAGLLVVIGNPVDTLGRVTNVANGASTEMLNSVGRGTLNEPQAAVNSTEEVLFDAVIKRPWCALQFGDVDYCLSTPEGLNQSVADTWMQTPADSGWREALWGITHSKDVDEAESEDYVEDGEEKEEEEGRPWPAKRGNLGDINRLVNHPDKVELMSTSTTARLGLFALIAIGLLGAIILFAYLAARLLIAALFVLILVMFAPAMFLVAALGEVGRKSVVAWFLRVLGAVLTKVVFALFLAVIIAACKLVSELNLGFFATWVVFTAFWWGVILKRKDLLSLVSLDTRTATPTGIDYSGTGSGNTLTDVYHAKRLMSEAGAGARRLASGVTAGPRALARRSKAASKDDWEATRQGESDAARQLAREELENDGRSTLERRNAEARHRDLELAEPVIRREKNLASRLSHLDEKIAKKRNAVRGGSPPGGALGTLEAERGEVDRELIALRSTSDFAKAKEVMGSKPRAATNSDVQAWMANRQSELAGSVDSEENLRAAGIDPGEFKRASSSEQDVMRAKSDAVMKRHAKLIDRAAVGHKGDEREVMTLGERREARDEARDRGNFDRYRDTASDRTRRHRQQNRDQRRSERRRNVSRRRRQVR